MRNKREHRRRAVVLILAAAALVTCAAPSLTSPGPAFAQAADPTSSSTGGLDTPRSGHTPTLRANGKIAFTSDRDGNREIYVMDPDGTNQTRITNNTVVDDHPTWSPDGLKIAFVSERTTGGRAIFTMNPDGTGRTEVTPVSYVDQYAYWPGSIWTDFYSMDWSPDGTQIVFQDNYDIVIVNADGSNRHAITDSTAYDLEPAWSPDGSKIVFSRDPLDDGGLLFGRLSTMSIDGSNLQFLPNAFQGQEYAPKWSPLGDKILFVIEYTDSVPDSVIYVTNADGSNDRLFDATPNAYEYRNKPSWSPDGRKILFDKWVDETVYPGDLEIYVKKIDGTESQRLTNTSGWNFNPSWQPLAPAACPNPIDCADFFVRQHYHDFLSREPDDAGLAFWTNEITSCGGDAGCVEAKRVNVSAAFFLSIEFQNTGYLVERMYKAAYGDATDALTGLAVPTVRRTELVADSALVGQGVVVNSPGWEQQLETNKQAYALAFVQRQRFTDAYPPSMAPAAFVAKLNENTGGALTQAEADALVAELSADQTEGGRASVLRKVAENVEVDRRERNRAFVLMQYFGYLRRNPDDPPDADFSGINFWLTKLNNHGGDYRAAEMVKSFLVSLEYRRRFGQP